MASYGRIEEFSADKENISNYLERVEFFFKPTELSMERKCQFFSALLEEVHTPYFEVYCHR